MTLGERLRYFRELRGIRIMQLSEESGVSQSTISEIENNNQNPRIDTLEKLCVQLNITLSELFDDCNDQSITELIYYAKQLTEHEKAALNTYLRHLLSR